jgi:hypothetical protein
LGIAATPYGGALFFPAYGANPEPFIRGTLRRSESKIAVPGSPPPGTADRVSTATILLTGTRGKNGRLLAGFYATAVALRLFTTRSEF